MAKQPSRPKRWLAAALVAETCAEDLRTALEVLEEIKSEYEEWHDNLPENLESSAVAEKLEAVVGLEFDPHQLTSEVDDAIQEAINAELPLGFGRD